MPFPALVMTSANVGHLAAMVGGDFFKRGLSMAVCLVVGRPFATKAIKARMNTTWRGARLISKPLGGPEKNEADEITRKECANKASTRKGFAFSSILPNISVSFERYCVGLLGLDIDRR